LLGAAGGTPPAAALGVAVLLQAWLKRRRQKRLQDPSASEPIGREPIVVHSESEPLPQVKQRYREFVPYEKPNGQLTALQWACDRYVQRHPGARATVEAIEAYADQYYSGLTEKQKQGGV